MKRVSTVGIIVLKDETVLLVRHGEKAGHLTGSYGTPGGRIDPGESLVRAAQRELAEESGLQAAEKDLIELPEKYEADLERKDGSTLHVYHTLFGCKIFTGELRGTEEATPEWIATQKLPEMELLPNTENMVRQALEIL